MPNFGLRSCENIRECHNNLQRLFFEVIKHYDCSVIEGHRFELEQDKLYHAGRSKLSYPNSLHNTTPSRAIDVVPYYPGEGIPWNDRDRLILFAGYVLGAADVMGINIRWGGDWNSDKRMRDHSFWDAAHFELI